MHIITWGAGEPVVLIHGSGDTDPTIVWTHQRSLAERYQLLILTRPGYGSRPLVSRTTVEQDVQETLATLVDKGGGHLVGFSYGGCIALIAAARQPELIRSLTVLEPPAWSVARGHPQIEQLIETSQPIFEPEHPLAPEAFLVRFMQTLQLDFPQTIELSAADRKGIEAMQAEPAPWKLKIPLQELTSVSFPILVVTSGEHNPFEAVAEVLTQQLGAQWVVCPGKGHYIPDTGELLNGHLDAFFQAAIRS